MSVIAETKVDTSGPCGHPLVDMLVTKEGYPHLTDVAALNAYAATDGAHCIFIPGDGATNLETPDVAVVLPELKMAFQGQFDCAVAQGDAEKAIKEMTGTHKTPQLVFFREGRPLSTMARVRDWSEYMARIPQILAMPTPEDNA